MPDQLAISINTVVDQLQLENQWLQMLTCMATMLSIVEASSITMIAVLYLIVPLNPSVAAGTTGPQTSAWTCQLWANSIFFELIIPELVLGVIGHAKSRQNGGKTGSMITAWRDHLMGSKRATKIAAVFIIVTFSGEFFLQMLNGMCVGQGTSDVKGWTLGQCPA